MRRARGPARVVGLLLAIFLPGAGHVFAGRRALGSVMLFIAGADDRTVMPSDGAAMARAAGVRASYVLVPGAGHVGAYFVDPSAYSGRVRAFLAVALPTGP